MFIAGLMFRVPWNERYGIVIVHFVNLFVFLEWGEGTHPLNGGMTARAIQN